MYLTHATIVGSPALRARITACAAQEGVDDPPRWAAAVAWQLPGYDWIAAWESADAAAGDAVDHGADAAVVTDGMILAAVQARIAGAG